MSQPQPSSSDGCRPPAWPGTITEEESESLPGLACPSPSGPSAPVSVSCARFTCPPGLSRAHRQGLPRPTKPVPPRPLAAWSISLSVQGPGQWSWTVAAMQGRCRTLCTQALGRLGELGHQQDCGGVAADQPGRPSQQEHCRGSISETKVQLGWGRGTAQGGPQCRRGGPAALGYEAGWVGPWVGGAPHLVARERRAAREGHLELGSSHSPFSRERVVTAPDQTAPPPPSLGLAPFLTSLLPVPGHLFSRRYCQRDLCAEHPVSPPGTSGSEGTTLTLRQASSSRLYPFVLTPPRRSLPTFSPEAATPDPEGSGGQGRVCVTRSCPQHLI